MPRRRRFRRGTPRVRANEEHGSFTAKVLIEHSSSNQRRLADQLANHGAAVEHLHVRVEDTVLVTDTGVVLVDTKLAGYGPSILEQMLEALDYSHGRGVVHRDLKPDNIMLGEFGEVFVMDWGLAKRVRGQGAEFDTTHQTTEPFAELSRDSFKTLSGQVKGTPRYMAPEQAEGRIEDIDERTDIYALGAILYTILTLHPPVSGGSASFSRRLKRSPPSRTRRDATRLTCSHPSSSS